MFKQMQLKILKIILEYYIINDIENIEKILFEKLKLVLYPFTKMCQANTYSNNYMLEFPSFLYLN